MLTKKPSTVSFPTRGPAAQDSYKEHLTATSSLVLRGCEDTGSRDAVWFIISDTEMEVRET